MRARNPWWGVRDVKDLEQEARRRALLLHEIVDMPANNMSLVLRRE
ncbi:MAG TPA: DUF938 domain-containing protein [Burkholderiales bacterium]|nr:DUF938 domain-containing protein [Burkholderiales bacterium]